ncbi:LacI family transcriptional regulator [Duganella sp. BJB488]|uniref:LacI family DNA-binding transcriptional regulator n=1 Tax=unclassified Duganella TaxID=2636909 RepID=UPI000E351AF7|nr:MULTISPECIES: LacI family DNA-binding transcriptional regulator [unclassified Duganella]NVD71253.1 LacI family DNA-binding transcriptional regulator [Duganella sp. BJB1802]RFP20511.1 LacI family transcriptional regulator [Duganella sp. BJB489]RFP21051.1 LacI family transcriptional regulator [Duganella sp. BJB488]RFP33188.1 LacI family transcriptional regulator [Duganella sp. BJB480]
MAITIKDVAQEAGVSVASVSRALNGHASITDDTRKHILAVVKRMRYMPHVGARSLTTSFTNTIGVLLPDLYGEFFSEMIRGIDGAARRRGLHLMVSSLHGDADEAALAIRAMRGRVDGLLVMSPHVDAAFLSDNLPEDLPIVLMNTAAGGTQYPSISVDNYSGAHAMVAHLIAGGYRRIAFLAGPSGNFEAQERLRGYRAALSELAPGAAEHVYEGDFSEQSGQAVGQALLEMDAGRRPDALFAANDMMAIGALLTLKQGGLRLPQDMALAGFDDIPIARYVSPALTTVRVPIADLGVRALESLVAKIGQPGSVPASAQTLGAELVARASTGESTPT